MKYREVNAEIREFLQGKDVPMVRSFTTSLS